MNDLARPEIKPNTEIKPAAPTLPATQQSKGVAATPPADGGVRAMLEKYKGEIGAALPKHLSADRMVRIALTEIRKTPKLLECDRASFLGALIQSAQLGLEPGGERGHSYLIPLWNNKKQINEVQFMPGYRGYQELFERSGKGDGISARLVYAGDEFSYEYGINETLVHKPCDEATRGEIVGVYAIAFLLGGRRPRFTVMTLNEVNVIRDEALKKTKGYGPWVDHYDEMVRKTAIRRLVKSLPLSPELQQAVGLDDVAEAGISQGNASIADVVANVEPTKPTARSLNDRVTAAKLAQKEQKPEQPEFAQDFDK